MLRLCNALCLSCLFVCLQPLGTCLRIHEPYLTMAMERAGIEIAKPCCMWCHALQQFDINIIQNLKNGLVVNKCVQDCSPKAMILIQLEDRFKFYNMARYIYYNNKLFFPLLLEQWFFLFYFQANTSSRFES